MAGTATRMELEKALVAYAPSQAHESARAFLAGLSLDELFFLAGFLGSCVLINSAMRAGTWDAVRYSALAFRYRSEGLAGHRDREHKLAVLREFALRCGFEIDFQHS